MTLPLITHEDSKNQFIHFLQDTKRILNIVRLKEKTSERILILKVLQNLKEWIVRCYYIISGYCFW